MKTLIMNKIKILAKLVFILFKTGSIKMAFFFSVLKGGANIQLVREFSLKEKSLTHIKSGKTIHMANLRVFNNDVSILKEAFENFSLEEIQGKLYTSMMKHGKKLKLQINSFDGWSAFYEILFKDMYEALFAEDAVVVDVGMNVGTASLFFASHDNVKKVYGFEPISSSCTVAETNFKLNEIGSKIQFTCAALGKGEKMIQIPKAFSGSVGASVTDFVMEQIHQPSDFKSTIDVLVKDASTVIIEIMEKHTEKIFLKLDCEGAEYEIIDDLFEQGLLSKISFIIIEWHYKGKRVLVEKLTQAGFNLFVPDLSVGIPVGLIYGVNRNSLSL